MDVRTKRILLIIILGVLVFGLYFNILYNVPTNWDDPSLVENPQKYALAIENIKRIFTITNAGTWQPVRDLSYMIDYALLPLDPVLAIHIHSILLYFFVALAVFLFLFELFRAFGNDEDKSFAWAAISSIIFAVHPVHVECVAWLYARKEPLLALFTMLSLWAFVKARTGQAGYFIISSIMLVLAVLSKPTALVIPAAMLTIDIALQMFNPERGYYKRRLLFLALVLLLVIPLSYWLISMMKTMGGVKPYHGGTFASNLLAVSQIFIEYMKLFSINIHYVADYPIRLYTSLKDWQAWIYAGLNASLIALAVVFLIRRRFILPVFVAWHYIFILPVSHIFPISQVLADRYGFLSSLSWCVLIGYLITWLGYKRINVRHLSANLPALVAVTAFVLLVFAYSFMTHMQTYIWRNSQILWENTLSRFPNSNSANVNLSVVYISQGRFEEAQKLCVNAIRNLPYDYLAISNLALSQMLTGHYDNAIHNYREALKLRPDLEKAKLGLANSYWGKGDLKSSYNIYSAIISSGFSLDGTPYAGLVYSRMAFCEYKMGNVPKARFYIEKADEASGQQIESLMTIADVATTMGLKDMAIRAYNRLLSVTQDTTMVEQIKTRMNRLTSG